jgi:hypothetical protein
MTQAAELALLYVERQFSFAGSLLIVAVLLVPFFIGWLVSYYENRLLWYFSEGQEILTKGNLIGSVITATSFPIFWISFGLLATSALFGEHIGMANIVDGTARPGAVQGMVYIPLTLILSCLSVAGYHYWAYRDKLADQPELRRLYLRWVIWLNVIAQVIMLAMLWAVLYLFPELVNMALQ